MQKSCNQERWAFVSVEITLVLPHYTHREIRILRNNKGRINRGLRQTQPELVKKKRLLPTMTQSSKIASQGSKKAHTVIKRRHLNTNTKSTKLHFLQTTSEEPSSLPTQTSALILAPKNQVAKKKSCHQDQRRTFRHCDTAVMHHYTHPKIRGVGKPQM